MTGLTILGYTLIGLGVIVGIEGGVQKPIDFMNSDFMSFLTSALVLITIGLAFINNVPQWLLLAALWITAVIIIIYMFGLHMPLWVFASGVIVTIGIGVWLTTLILKK